MDVRRVGQYELYDEIASGGMAVVRFGRFVNDLGLGRLVAIKCLHPWFGSDAAFTSALIEEAKLALRVRHTNVVATVDVLVPHDEVFLVMDYVHGVSLSELLKRSQGEERPVPVPVASAIMVGILHGIHAAHEATAVDGEPLGIVHRDVSPQNVLVDVDGIARVFDFGVARAVGRVQNTKDGVVKGKMGYMSPEQFMRDEVDRRTDVFAASVVYWEMLVGRQLFPDASLGAVYGRMLEPRIEPPSAKVRGLPTSYDSIVLKGLSQLADDRFSTARDMALAVEEAGPLATQREVGAWVEELASETLRQRAKRIAQVERRAPLPPQQKHLSAPPPGPDPSDKATWMPRNRQPLVPPVDDGRSETALGDVPVGSGADSPAVAGEGTEARSRWWAVAGALALVAVLWIAISAVSGSRSRSAPGVTTTTAATVAVPSSAASTPFAVREPTAPANASPEDSSPLGPAVSFTPPSEGSGPPSLPRVFPERVPASKPPPAPSVKCNPPYYIDGRGVRVLKPECL
jgi:serine/threonine-protein kinase